MAAYFYPGKRLSFDGQLCTVRYVGEVKGTKGEWLGVEWDDPIRGKHSGEHGGIRYFECVRKHPTAGSFVRPTRKPDPSRSFVEALKAKYASEDFEDPHVDVVYVGKAAAPVSAVAKSRAVRISGKEVEEVGFDKIRKQLAELSELRIVILDGLCMHRPVAHLKATERSSSLVSWPESTDIKDACPKTTELDLSRNLFEEWREVVSICEQLDKLKSLRVDGVRLRDITLTEAERERALVAFKNITILKLEANLLPWKDVTSITRLFPQVSTFVASSNFYTSLSNDRLTDTITDLTFEENEFSSFTSLESLTHLTRLQRLVLKSNKIIEVAESGRPLPVFPSTLTEVDLSYNEISSWSFIDKLPHVFPGLTSLRVSHNPLYHSLRAADGRALSAEDGYMLTLARLKNLKVLNYSPITEKERLNAESYYLSLIAREVVFAPENQEEQILASHPRYKELCEEYGEPVIRREANAVNPNSLAARLMRITFHRGEEATGQLSSKYEVEVPRSSTVYTVLGMVVKHYGLSPRLCKMIWQTGDWMPAPGSGEEINDGQDSESDSDGGDNSRPKPKGDSVMREAEIVPGTRSIGTWIDGKEAVVKVELVKP